jgi:hypothetical protein
VLARTPGRNRKDEEVELKSTTVGQAVPIGIFCDPDLDDPAVALDWYRNFTPPEPDPEVLPVSAAFPRYMKDGAKALGRETGCDVLTFTTTGRSASWWRLASSASRNRANGTGSRDH